MPEHADASRPRLVREISLPAYSYVPGQFPHPFSDPGGHSYGVVLPRPQAADPVQWQSSPAYCYGIDLFNHGYYWEAHEAWEGLWHACGRRGTTASFLKGLIKLAAAGVKARQGIAEGVRGHGRRAAELFEEVAAHANNSSRYMGLDLSDLAGFAETLAARPIVRQARSDESVEIVFDLVLRPE